MAKMSREERLELRVEKGRVLYEAVEKGTAFDLPRIMCIGLQKGGVAKTTLVSNLGSALTALNKKVLLVDMDPQGSLTLGLEVDLMPDFDDEMTMREVLVGDIPIANALQQIKPNLFIAPAFISLYGAIPFLQARPSPTTALSKALQSVKDLFDYILIDTPPGFGVLVQNALFASSEVIIPWVQSDPYSTYAVPEYLHSILEIQEMDKSRAHINGVINTIAVPKNNSEPSTRAGRVNTELMIESYGPDIFFKTEIPRNTRLSEGIFVGNSAIDYDAKSPGAQAYLSLAKEIINQEVTP